MVIFKASQSQRLLLQCLMDNQVSACSHRPLTVSLVLHKCHAAAPNCCILLRSGNAQAQLSDYMWDAGILT